MTPILITPDNVGYVSIALYILVYFLLVRFNWAFLAPADRYRKSPFQLFTRRWFGNLFAAFLIVYFAYFFVLALLDSLSFGLIKVDRAVFGDAKQSKDREFLERTVSRVEIHFMLADTNTRMELIHELWKNLYLLGLVNPTWGLDLQSAFEKSQEHINRCRTQAGRAKFDTSSDEGAIEFLNAVLAGELPHISIPCT